MPITHYCVNNLSLGSINKTFASCPECIGILSKLAPLFGFKQNRNEMAGGPVFVFVRRKRAHRNVLYCTVLRAA